MNVAFIGAHPDDEMFCLGTLLLCRRRGDRLFLICATNGDKGISDDPDFPHAECARLRDREMREVARAIDAEYQCLGEPDEALYDTWDNRLKMIEAIRHTQADLLFTHFSQDYNLDHSTTSALVFQGALLSQIASVRTEKPGPAACAADLLCGPRPGIWLRGDSFRGD